jgi:hypothetical protein
LDHIEEALGKINGLTTINTKAMSMLGARAMVQGKFLDATLPQLTALQRIEVTRSFRQGIEEALMDDVPLPTEYHSTMLKLTNTIIAALDR